ncbi:unnamed protein product [Prunus brigantina]
MNQTLLSEFTAEEVKHALFQMHPSKAPGPDGMSPFFFQKYWDVVGGEVTAAILDFLRTGKLLPKLNFTHVALIPKVKDPTNMTQFRPISLCNVIYKIGAKVLANRLKLILNDVIGVQQSAFVPGRMISDNSIVAFEVLHYMHNRTHGKLGFQALKLDMSKAYDRVEWGFLETIMNNMGFAPRWVQLIMTCVTTVTYSFLVNSSPVGYISPQRGLRQGDPLSPYLFLLCAEVFSGLIAQAEQQGFLHGIAISRGAPSISHLLFADDSFLFTRATPEECRHRVTFFNPMNEPLDKKLTCGRVASLSVVMWRCPGNMPWPKLLGCERVDKHDKYLGIPTFIGRSRKIYFAPLKERVWKKVQGWREKLLGFAGKEVLLKVVAQAVPIYQMSCFQIPRSLCDDIQQVMAKYWWGGNEDKRKIHWMSWNRLCKPKREGGMGFRNLYAFNMALLAKQVWRIYHQPHSLLARVLKARYHKDCTILEASEGHSPSYIWRSLCDSRVVLTRGSLGSWGWSVGESVG